MYTTDGESHDLFSVVDLDNVTAEQVDRVATARREWLAVSVDRWKPHFDILVNRVSG